MPGLLATMIDWTQVLVVGIPAYIGAILGGVAAIYAARNHRNLKTPSGDAIGHVAERTHDLAAVNAMAVARVEKTVNGVKRKPEPAPDA